MKYHLLRPGPVRRRDAERPLEHRDDYRGQRSAGCSRRRVQRCVRRNPDRSRARCARERHRRRQRREHTDRSPRRAALSRLAGPERRRFVHVRAGCGLRGVRQLRVLREGRHAAVERERCRNGHADGKRRRALHRDHFTAQDTGAAGQRRAGQLEAQGRARERRCLAELAAQRWRACSTARRHISRAWRRRWGRKKSSIRIPIGATGNSSLRAVSGGFQFNWDTTTTTTNPIKTPKGCYTVLLVSERSVGTEEDDAGAVEIKRRAGFRLYCPARPPDVARADFRSSRSSSIPPGWRCTAGMIGETFDLHHFADAALVVVNRREIPERGLFVQQQRERFARRLRQRSNSESAW